MVRPAPARDKILNATFTVIRTKGYSAASVDDLCAAAGVTKGAFFHHFASKDALGVAVAQHWSNVTSGFFAGAPYKQHSDPLERVLGYLDFRRDILQGELPDFTCLVGTMVQEVHQSSPAITAACDASISGHAETIEADIAQAMALYSMVATWTAKSLALHTQAVLQGAFILAKAKGGAAIAADSIDHLKRYISLLFANPQPGERT